MNIKKMIDKRNTKGLIKALSSDKDFYIRKAAAEALGTLKDPYALEVLINALDDVSSRVREAAVVALGELKDPRAVEPLIHALYEGDFDVRMAAARALGNLNDQRAVEPLIKCLEDGDKDIKITAIKSLIKIKGHPRIAGALVKAMEDKDYKVKNEAINGLIATRDPRSMEILINTLPRKDLLQWKIVNRPSNMNDARGIIRASEDSNKETRLAAIRTLNELGYKHAIEPLKKAIEDADKDLRLAVVYALLRLNDKRTTELFIKALVDPEWEIREAAAQGLGKRADPKAVAPLINALEDSHECVRLAAVQSLTGQDLSDIEDPRLLRVLSQMLDDHESVQNRITVANKLSQLAKDDGVTELFLKALGDCEQVVREKVVQSLGRWNGPRTSKLLMNMLEDTSQNVRLAAVKALSGVCDAPDPRLLFILSQMLEDHETIQNRITAAEVLARFISEKDAVEMLIKALRDREWEVREKAVQSLGAWNDAQAIKLLMDMLEDASESVRLAVVEALSHMSDLYVVEALIKAARNNNSRVREKAVRSFGKWNDPQVIRLLMNMLADICADVRLAAFRTLAGMNGSHVVEAVIKALKDSNDEVRLEAIHALDWIPDLTDDRRMIEALTAALDSNVAYAAAKALLQKFKDISHVMPLVRATLARALEALQYYEKLSQRKEIALEILKLIKISGEKTFSNMVISIATAHNDRTNYAAHSSDCDLPIGHDDQGIGLTIEEIRAIE